ncbi:M24 family metallopeptidase [Actinophytocola sp.]|uniref:M24 family metallopeptidase n=1 Tax=Actinophytocola sp. TaxID=1872138 RepID=UPI003D6AAB1A
MSFEPVEFERRWERAQKAMREADLDALLIGDKYNFWYLTGNLTKEIDKKRPMLVFLPASGPPTYIIYAAAKKKSEATTPSARILTYDGLPFPTQLVKDTLTEAGLTTGRLGMELGLDERLGLSYQEFMDVKESFPSLTLVDAGKQLQQLRMVKTELEVDAIRTACELSLRAWDSVTKQLRLGMTNPEIRKMIAVELTLAGTEFDIAGHISIGDGVAGIEGYRPGEVLWSDFGGTYLGYQADVARRVAFVEPAPAQVAAQEKIGTLMSTALDALRPGVPCSQVARTCNQALESLGLPPVSARKRIGHGLGLAAGEPPSLSERDETILRPGMVVTMEPRFTLPSGEKVHVEEVLVITEEGCARLSDGAESMQVVLT